MIATFTIPMRPPSVNGMYISKYRGGKILSPAGKKFKNFVKYHVNTEFQYDKTTHTLEAEIFFYLNGLFTKSKTVSNTCLDIDNGVKIAIDSIFECLEINDSQICKLTVQKLEANQDCIVFILKTMPLSLVRQRVAL